ncbi:TetR/AcrR family transcriptional regulator [Nonomuraea sp. LPB2021202275-12-8]|uniref:TetR/AcrR family transcriptional regulator n=1 Tax=Nonomuraea sp. LPB2021202275-12-8 TaxID=3120159 RepID=UPI00300D2EDA
MQPENRSTAQDGGSFIEQARRAQIVRSAITTIAELGHARASFARIAERAGVSPALISYHFAGKDELIEQVLAEVLSSMRAEISTRTERAQSYTEALTMIIEAQVHYFATHQVETMALGAIRSAVGTGPSTMAWAGRAESLAELEEFLRAGQQAGEFRAFPPRVVAASILASLEDIPAELRARPDTDVRVHARELAALFDRATRRDG